MYTIKIETLVVVFTTTKISDLKKDSSYLKPIRVDVKG